MSISVASLFLLLGALLQALAQPTDPPTFAAANGSHSVETQWYLPVYSPTNKARWGVRIAHIERSPVSPFQGNLPFSAFRYSEVPFNTNRPVEWSNTNIKSNISGPIDDQFASAEYFADAVHYASNSTPNDRTWLPASGDGFLIGNRANFTTSHLVDNTLASTYSFRPGVLSNATWSSIPFGMALGVSTDNSPAGSMVFGGSYDWARVNDTQWHRLPLDDPDGFLLGGVAGLPEGSARVGNPNVTQIVELDYFYNYKIILPKNLANDGASCNGTVNITIAGARFDVPTSQENCNYDNDPDANIVKLGVLFWQYMYLYADADNAVYVARALKSNAPVSIRKFNASAEIEQHPEAKYVPPPASSAARSIPEAVFLLCLLAFSSGIFHIL